MQRLSTVINGAFIIPLYLMWYWTHITFYILHPTVTIANYPERFWDVSSSCTIGSTASTSFTTKSAAA